MRMAQAKTHLDLLSCMFPDSTCSPVTPRTMWASLTAWIRLHTGLENGCRQLIQHVWQAPLGTDGDCVTRSDRG